MDPLGSSYPERWRDRPEDTSATIGRQFFLKGRLKGANSCRARVGLWKMRRGSGFLRTLDQGSFLYEQHLLIIYIIYYGK